MPNSLWEDFVASIGTTGGTVGGNCESWFSTNVDDSYNNNNICYYIILLYCMEWYGMVGMVSMHTSLKANLGGSG